VWIVNLGYSVLQVVTKNRRLHRVTDSSETRIGSLPAGRRWLMPVILATQKAEIRRVVAQSQPEQIVCETLS
jgi:hypothetical protein